MADSTTVRLTEEQRLLLNRPYLHHHFTYQPLNYSSPPPLDTILNGPDRRWFMELFLRIPTQTGLRRMKLFPWEQEIAQGQVTNYELMLKAREIGSSTFWVGYFIRDVITRPGGNMLIVANKEENAQNLLSYAKAMIQNLPDGIRPTVGKENETEITFPRLGNHIKAVPGKPDACRSERATIVIATEVAFWEKQEELWAAVQGVLVPGGSLVAESTANSESDLFHDLYYDSVNEFRKHFYGWRENPSHDEEWYLSRRKIIKEDFLFFREYPSTPEEAFQSSGDIYFYAGDIDRGQQYIRLPTDEEPVVRDGRTFGYLRIWKGPLAGHNYVVGVDCAEGKSNDRGRPDYSVAYVLHQLTGEVVAVLHCRLPEDEFARELFDLGRVYNTALLAIERNGPGLAVIRIIQLLSYGDDNFFYHRRFDPLVRGAQRAVDEIGWLTTKNTKATLIGELNDAMHEGAWVCPEPLFWDEAKSFGRDLRARSTAHDDHIMAGAIAWRARNNNPHPGRDRLHAPLSTRDVEWAIPPSWKGMWGTQHSAHRRRRRVRK